MVSPMTTAYKAALDSALRILTRRDHSAAELRRKLVQRRFEREVIDQVISECRRLNYLDDSRFAKGLIRHIKRKGRGPQHLKQDCRRRGLKGAEIERLLIGAYGEGEELQIAMRVAAKKLASIGDLEPRKCREKIYRFLVSRGFSKTVILETLRDVIQY